MRNIILLPGVIIEILCAYANMKSAMKVNRNIFMGVTLPKEVLESQLIKDMQYEYKKILNRYIMAMIVTSIPIFLLKKSSLSMIYLLIWCFSFMMYFMTKPYKMMNRRLKQLKQEKEWFVGEKKLVVVDTKVTMLKKQMPISSKYFIIPILLSVIPISMGISNIEEYGSITVFVGIMHLFIMIGEFFIFRSFNNMKLKTYSENSDINYAINKTEKRMYSIFWTTIATIDSVGLIIIYMEMLNYIDAGIWIIYATVFILPILMLSGFLYIKKKLELLEKELIENDNRAIFVDEDEYWIDGLYYYNENNKSSTVRGRFGFNTTYNLATKSGKFFGKTLQWIVILGVTVPVSLIMLRLDFLPHSVDIDKNNQDITINCPSYKFEFESKDIESIEILNETPKYNLRTNGASTSEYSRGNYNVSKYGKSKMYIYYENPYCIVIKLKDNSVNYIFYNEKSYEETEKVYKQLQAISKTK